MLTTYKCPECGKHCAVFMNGVCQLCNFKLAKQAKKD